MFGISLGTVRKYVNMGLIPPPVGKGPSAYYLPESRERIQQIRDIVHDGKVTLGDLSERPYDKKNGWIQA